MNLIKRNQISYKIKINNNKILKKILKFQMIYLKKKLFICYLNNSKQIEEIMKKKYQKIIFTDYKNYKKFQKKFY